MTRHRNGLFTLTQERFPKLEIVKRKKMMTGSHLISQVGSWSSQVFDLLTDLFPLRSCSYELTQENIDKGKFKTCLEYQMGRCSSTLCWVGINGHLSDESERYKQDFSDGLRT
jgi:excinuclease ABC subunit C